VRSQEFVMGGGGYCEGLRAEPSAAESQWGLGATPPAAES